MFICLFVCFNLQDLKKSYEWSLANIADFIHLRWSGYRFMIGSLIVNRLFASVCSVAVANSFHSGASLVTRATPEGTADKSVVFVISINHEE